MLIGEIENVKDESEAFWSLIIRLCLRGRLPEAWDIFSRNAVVQKKLAGESASSEDLRCLSELKALFLSHPSTQPLDEANHTNTTTADSYVMLQMQWRSRLQALRSSGYRLLGLLPEVSPMLRALAGELSPNSSLWGDAGWQIRVLVELLYSSKVPKSRSELVRIVVQNSSANDPCHDDRRYLFTYVFA